MYLIAMEAVAVPKTAAVRGLATRHCRSRTFPHKERLWWERGVAAVVRSGRLVITARNEGVGTIRRRKRGIFKGRLLVSNGWGEGGCEAVAVSVYVQVRVGG